MILFMLMSTADDESIFFKLKFQIFIAIFGFCMKNEYKQA